MKYNRKCEYVNWGPSSCLSPVSVSSPADLSWRDWLNSRTCDDIRHIRLGCLRKHLAAHTSEFGVRGAAVSKYLQTSFLIQNTSSRWVRTPDVFFSGATLQLHLLTREHKQGLGGDVNTFHNYREVHGNVFAKKQLLNSRLFYRTVMNFFVPSTWWGREQLHACVSHQAADERPVYKRADMKIIKKGHISQMNHKDADCVGEKKTVTNSIQPSVLQICSNRVCEAVSSISMPSEGQRGIGFLKPHMGICTRLHHVIYMYIYTSTWLSFISVCSVIPQWTSTFYSSHSVIIFCFLLLGCY